MKKFGLLAIFILVFAWALPANAFSNSQPDSWLKNVFDKNGKVLSLTTLGGSDVCVSADCVNVQTDFTSPKEDEAWNFDSTHDITWAPSGSRSSVSIAIINLDSITYSLASDAAGLKYVGGYIAKNIPDNGKFSWTISGYVIPLDLSEFEDLNITADTKLITGSYYIFLIGPDGQSISTETKFKLERQGIAAPSIDKFMINGEDAMAEDYDPYSASIKYGSEIVLEWASSNASSCEGQASPGIIPMKSGGYWSDQKNLPALGSNVLLAKPEGADYALLGLKCTNSFGDLVSKTVPIEIETPQEFEISISQPTDFAVIKAGTGYDLAWTGAFPESKVSILLTGVFGSGYIAKDITNDGAYYWDTKAPLLPDDSRQATALPNKLMPGNYSLLIFSDNPYTSDSISIKVEDPAFVNTFPIGSFDGFADGELNGWALDPDLPESWVSVKIYSDGPKGKGKEAGYGSAYDKRFDVNQATGFAGDHGYSAYIYPEFKDGKPHSFYVYAADKNDSAQLALLPGSPKTIAIMPEIDEVRDGALYQDQGVIYAIAGGKKRAFTSMEVFKGLGYRLSNVSFGDTSKIEAGEAIGNTNLRHPRGAVVLHNNTIYFMGSDLRYAFTSEDIFKSWNLKFEYVVPANQADLSVPEGPVMLPKGSSMALEKRDAIRIADIRQMQTALELYFNDNNAYPSALSQLAPMYIKTVPVDPLSAATYVYSSTSTAYTLTFATEGATNLGPAGNHMATQNGIQ
ncbi:MAG: hypothetical protein ACM3KM_01270 [Acidobacteriaceae bacterium]